MNRIFNALLCAALFFTVTGCEEPLIPEAGKPADIGRGDGPKIVPNGGGRTTDDLIFDEDIRCYSMDNAIDEQAVTTRETLGRWKEGKDKDKYAVQALSYLSTSSMNADGFADTYFVYYNVPLEGEFKFSARLRMTAINSNTTSKGVQFGAFAPLNPPEPDNGQKFTNVSRSAGIQFRTGIAANNPTGEIRYYYAKDGERIDNHAGSSTAGGNGDQILYGTNWKTEYIFEVSRDSASNYTYAVRNSKTGAIEPNTVKSANNPRTIAPVADDTNNANLHESLKCGWRVFAGVALMGSSAEISRIRIWDIAKPAEDGTDDAEHLLFSTPDTEPAYVPAERLTLTFNPPQEPETGSNPPRYVYASVPSSPVTLTPVFEPAWTDQQFIEWFTESCAIDGAPVTDPALVPLRITGAGDFFTVDGVFEDDGITLKTTWRSGQLLIDGGLIPPGSTASAIFKAVSRDLALDAGPPPANHSLLQTLAECRFEVSVTGE
jgi:hypothetical protein